MKKVGLSGIKNFFKAYNEAELIQSRFDSFKSDALSNFS